MEWTDSGFLDEAEGWIRDQVKVLGPIEQTHVQLWGTVIRVPTRDGPVWFKAAGEAQSFEPLLIEILAEVAPGKVPDLVAIDRERRWMITADAGRSLRGLVTGPADIRLWEEFLPQYASVQISALGRVDDLLAIGVPDERLAGLTDRIREVMSVTEYLMIGLPGGLDDHERVRMESSLDEVARLCDDLAGMGVPDSIQHDDLNDGNVFVDGGAYRTMDWGDACVSHPFHSLTVQLRATAARLDLQPGGAEIIRMRDAYLEPFEVFAPRTALEEAASIAYRTGTLARVHAWHRYISDRRVEDRAEDMEAIPYGIRKFLANEPMGFWRD